MFKCKICVDNSDSLKSILHKASIYSFMKNYLHNLQRTERFYDRSLLTPARQRQERQSCKKQTIAAQRRRKLDDAHCSSFCLQFQWPDKARLARPSTPIGKSLSDQVGFLAPGDLECLAAEIWMTSTDPDAFTPSSFGFHCDQLGTEEVPQLLSSQS